MIGIRSILSLLLAAVIAMPLCCCQAIANDPAVYVGTGKASSVSSKPQPAKPGHGCCTKKQRASKSCPKKQGNSCCCGSACQAAVIEAKSDTSLHAAIVVAKLPALAVVPNFDFTPAVSSTRHVLESPPAPGTVSSRLAMLCVYRC